MRITFQLTQGDLVKFNEYHAAHSPLHIKAHFRQRILIPIIYLGIAILGVFCIDYTFAAMFTVLSVIWFLLYPKWIKKRYKKHFTRYVSENFSDVDTEPSSISLQEDGIHSESYLGYSVFNYSAVDKIVENDGVTYVYIGKGIALVIPHDRVSDTDREALLSEINQRRESAGTASS